MPAVKRVTKSKVVASLKRRPSAKGFKILWLNHLDLLPGDPSVKTTFNAILNLGQEITSTATGDTSPGGGNKVVEMAVAVPPGYTVRQVRVCYRLTNRRSFITQIRLAQVQNPPATALVLLDDPTNHTNPGPLCVDSFLTTIDPSLGPLLLSLRLNFGNTADRIIVVGVGLLLS